MPERGLISVLIICYQLVIAGGAGLSGLEYLQPGPNYVRLCCNLVNVSAWELVYNSQTNSTSMVSVFGDTPVSALLLNTIRMSRENSPSMNVATIALGPDSKIEMNKMYLICVSTVTSSMRQCFAFRPCDCATCTTTKPWIMYNVTNVPSGDPDSIRLYAGPTFPTGKPTLAVSIRVRIWDGMLYRGCQSYPNSGVNNPQSGCGLMAIHPEDDEAYFDDTVVWSSGPNSTTPNYTKSFSIRDEGILATVTAGFNVTVMLSLLDSSYDDLVISVPTKAWNRNGFSTYSQIIPYATPFQTNGYRADFDDPDEISNLCQQVLARKAADQVTTTTRAVAIASGSTVASGSSVNGTTTTVAPASNSTRAANGSPQGGSSGNGQSGNGTAPAPAAGGTGTTGNSSSGSSNSQTSSGAASNSTGRDTAGSILSNSTGTGTAFNDTASGTTTTRVTTRAPTAAPAPAPAPAAAATAAPAATTPKNRGGKTVASIFIEGIVVLVMILCSK